MHMISMNSEFTNGCYSEENNTIKRSKKRMIDSPKIIKNRKKPDKKSRTVIK